MIIARDFAQLPPVRGYALYSNDVAKVQDFTHSKRSQESTIGKILWHQFTMVVILKQNMRQRVLVFAGSVAWTEKKTETEPNTTKKDQTNGCGCTNSEVFRLPVTRFYVIWKDH